MKWQKTAKGIVSEPEGFPWIILILIAVVCIGGDLLLKFVDLPTGKNADTAYYLKDLYIPVLISFLIGGIFGFMYMVFLYCYSLSDYLERHEEREFWKWAIQRLIILDHSIVSPVDNLALKLLYLEGDIPLYPVTPMKLEIDDHSIMGSKITGVVDALIESLKTTLSKSIGGIDAWVYLRDDTQNIREDIQTSLKQADLNVGDVSFFDECPDYKTINKWIDNRTNKDFLFIVLELHKEDDESYFEHGVAFVLSNDRDVNEYSFPLYLLRSIDSAVGKLRENIELYLNARQLEIQSIKNVWLNGYPKSTKALVLNCINTTEYKDKDGKQQTFKIPDEKQHAIEVVTGPGASASYSWLSLALAAEAIKCGEGNQLVSEFTESESHLTMLSGKNPGYWRDVVKFSSLEFMFPACGLLALVFAVITFCISSGITNDPWYIFFFLAVVITAVTAFGVFVFSFFTDKIQSEMGAYLPFYW